MIYLDYTAHMPPDAVVVAAFCQAERENIGNANAHHAAGRMAEAAMRDAVLKVASLLSVREDEVIFTSGASESNNTAIQGMVYAARHFGRHIITTPLEHPSVSGCLTALQERGYEIDVLSVNRDGQIDLTHLKKLLRKDTVLLTLCAVDSELGVIQPVQEVSEILREYPNCRLHLDVTQAVGKIPFELSLADTASFSGHKFGGVTGSGVLYKKKGTEMEPLIHGGVSTSLYRSGTPAVGLAVSLSMALEKAMRERETRFEIVSHLNRRLRGELRQRGFRIHSPEKAIPHILNIGVDGVKGSAFRDALDERGICVSVKSACSVELTPSRAVYAVTGNRRQAMDSFRISLSHQTTEAEIRELLKAMDEICREKRA